MSLKPKTQYSKSHPTYYFKRNSISLTDSITDDPITDICGIDDYFSNDTSSNNSPLLKTKSLPFKTNLKKINTQNIQNSNKNKTKKKIMKSPKNKALILKEIVNSLTMFDPNIPPPPSYMPQTHPLFNYHYNSVPDFKKMEKMKNNIPNISDYCTYSSDEENDEKSVISLSNDDCLNLDYLKNNICQIKKPILIEKTYSEPVKIKHIINSSLIGFTGQKINNNNINDNGFTYIDNEYYNDNKLKKNLNRIKSKPIYGNILKNKKNNKIIKQRQNNRKKISLKLNLSNIKNIKNNNNKGSSTPIYGINKGVPPPPTDTPVYHYVIPAGF